MDLSARKFPEEKVCYEFDEQQQVLIRCANGELPKIISKSNFVWRDLGPEDELYARAIFLGEGCWEKLKTISEEHAKCILSEWEVESREHQGLNEETKTAFVLKGNICYSENKDTLKTVQDAYLVCLDGKSAGVYSALPKAFQKLPLIDYGEKLIIPGMVDLHIHAPQVVLDKSHVNSALKVLLDIYDIYENFANALKKGATTRAVIYSDPHKVATDLFLGVLEDTGLVTYVSADKDAKEYPDELANPIPTTNVSPCCLESVTEALRWMNTGTKLPVLTHTCENSEEIDSKNKHYDENCDNGYMEPHKKTLMVHCDWSTEKELQFMQKNNIFAAHCSDFNKKKCFFGVAATRKHLDMNIPVGFGSENAEEDSNSIFRAMVHTIGNSKLYWKWKDNRVVPLLFSEVFYMATKGGGAFFGCVGSFEPGYEFDAVVLDDSTLFPLPLTLAKRVERAVYTSLDENAITAKYVRGSQII